MIFNQAICLDAKRLKVKGQIEEMVALDNAGMRTNQRFVELSYMVNEYEEEEEQRNYQVMAKLTTPVNIAHHRHPCIGTQTCLRQKNIKKVFAHTMIQCSKNAKYSEEVEAATRRDREEKAR